MEQDEIEDELFYQSICGHVQLVLGVLQSSAWYRSLLVVVYRQETIFVLISILALLLYIARLDRGGRLQKWFGGCAFVNSFYIQPSEEKGEVEWSEVTDNCVIYSMQGRRPGNEDRAACRTVKTGLTGSKPVHIFAVMDGHGGEFAVNYANQHLLKSVENSIHQLKTISSGAEWKEKLLYYHQTFGQVPDCVRKYWNISETEYNTIIPQPKQKTPETKTDSEAGREDAKPDESESTTVATEAADLQLNKNDKPAAEEPEKPVSRTSLVLASRQKSLEELPEIPKTPKTPTSAPKKLMKIPQSKPKKSAKNKSSGKAEKEKEEEAEITSYIGSAGEILFPKLIKDEILKCDKNLIRAAKRASAIGGTTLLLSILDEGKLWAANVGDSRGIYCSDSGQAIPLSFDHKPCQLKEKRRIQEAGGFVSLNGVWRVQGVLATSRALGDYPLKEKNVIVADPDVLSFNVRDHKIEFAVLATDGLWDTHSNEEVAEIMRNSHRDLHAVRNLAHEAYTRGSTDNITLVLLNINKYS